MKDYLQDDLPVVMGWTAPNSVVPDTDLAAEKLKLALLLPANANHPVAGQGHPAPVAGTGARSLYRLAGKRVLDVLFVIATLPLSVPLIILCALALRIEGGTPFYRQDRLGRGGGRYSILKLRTMVRDADDLLARYLENDPDLRAEWDTTQKLKDDPRITRVGRFLRATSLDELPQLWNVLIGDMSLVGPRPMMPQQLPLYGDARAYFATRPGITGVWQVSARNETRFSYRAGLDRQYVRDLSLKIDLGLLVKTIGVVLRRTGY